jgi:PAS domain-containing protein
VSEHPPDPDLVRHLERIKAYMRESGLLRAPEDHRDLRRELAAFIERRTPAILDAWMREIGRALGIKEQDWPQLKADQAAAIARWARHIADPEDIETYRLLREHARRGFISRFPASRLLVAQMRFIQRLQDGLREEYAADPAHAHELSELLAQEFRARVLHITDFFVEAREEEMLAQEASYRRAIDRAPACILMADAREGRIFDASQLAEELLGSTSSCPPRSARARRRSGAPPCARGRPPVTTSIWSRATDG